MFGIPGKAAVTLTPAATRQIARLMEKQSSQGLRIGVKKGGCAGMEYTMDYVTSVNPLDEVVEQDGARVPEILVDVGTADPFFEQELRPELLEQACADAGIALTLNRRDGYDHSYFFISTFMADHVSWHGERLA